MSNQSSTTGIGIFSLLGILFVGLKLTGHIDWSWWWVTAPFWGPTVFILTFFIASVIIFATLSIFKLGIK